MSVRRDPGAHLTMGPDPYLATCHGCGGEIMGPPLPCPLDQWLDYCRMIERLHARCGKRIYDIRQGAAMRRLIDVISEAIGEHEVRVTAEFASPTAHAITCEYAGRTYEVRVIELGPTPRQAEPEGA